MADVLIPELPSDIVIHKILPSISWWDIKSAAAVNKAWKSALQFPFLQISHKEEDTDVVPIITKGKDFRLSVHYPTKKDDFLLPPIPGLAIASSELAYEKGMLYALGGINCVTGKAVSHVYAINLIHGYKEWVKIPSMASARCGFACIMARSKIYVAGGWGEGFRALATSEVYDVQKRKWESLPDLPNPESICKGAVSADCVYVFAGSCGPLGSSAFMVHNSYILKYGCRDWIRQEVFNMNFVSTPCKLQLGIPSLVPNEVNNEDEASDIAFVW